MNTLLPTCLIIVPLVMLLLGDLLRWFDPSGSAVFELFVGTGVLGLLWNLLLVKKFGSWSIVRKVTWLIANFAMIGWIWTKVA